MLLVFAPLSLLAATSAMPAGETFTVDPTHSSVVFKVKHGEIAYFRGRFNQIEGRITVDREDPTKSTVEVVVAAESVDTNAPGRDRHVKSPDFLDVNQFPTIEFKSTAVKPKGDDTFEITGDLKLHGVTKSITVNATRTGEGSGRRGEKLIGFDVEFAVKRSDFGMNWGLDGRLGDEVSLAIGIEARHE